MKKQKKHQTKQLAKKQKSQIAKDSSRAETNEKGKGLAPEEHCRSGIMNALPIITWVSDVSGKPICFNRRWYAFVGTTGAKEPGFATVVHSEDFRKFSQFIKSRPGSSMQVRLKSKSGKYCWYQAEIVRLDGSGKNTRWLGSLTDIHSQKESEESLLAAKNSLEIKKANDTALMESIGEAVLATDVDERIVFANKSAEDMFGFKEKEMIGMLFSELFVLHDKLGASYPSGDFLIPQVLKTGKRATDSTLYYTTAHKKKFPAAVTTSPIRFDGRVAGTMSIFRNTRREAQIDKAKTEFVSLASHQLRTPLTAVKLLTEMLLSEQYGKWNLGQRDILQNIEQANEKMIRLVDNLLDVANMEANRMWVEPELLTPSEFVHSVINEASPLAHSRGIQVVYKDMPKDSTVIDTDPYLLRQILNNIITNAIEYSRAGKKVIVKVDWHANKECVISVQDHGIGIAKKAQREIFNRFFRAENAIKFKTESSGLGLYVCKMMVEALGGRITFKTEIQKGTTFFIHLPIKNNRLQSRKNAHTRKRLVHYD